MEPLFQAGAVLAQRFQIVSAAGHGGMGRIYRGVDLRTGRPIAIKLLRAFSAASDVERFAREAQFLSEMQHPGIVSYVSHGTLDSEQPFLVTEWLNGEDLARRLRRKPLSLAESLQLLSQVAAALRLPHQRGIAHRDLKPSNIFLRDGQVERATLLDFGIARSVSEPRSLTRTGVVMGTAEYMSPEQASGQREHGLSVDVFALGCVLFECLTSKPPFTGEHVASVLAKILFFDAPRLRSLRPELPQALDELLLRMLSKNPIGRLQDAVALLEALAPIAQLPHTPLHLPPPQARSAAVVGTEQHLVSVILATEDPSEDGAETKDAAQSITRREALAALCKALAAFGAQTQRMGDDTLIVALMPASSAATDQAAHAARCALFIKERWPAAVVALATGRGRLSARVPIGEALDRAGGLLRRGFVPSDASGQVLLDELTAGLLDGRFLVSTTAAGTLALTGEEPSLDPLRPLLGKPTPCVGREQELGMLEGVLRTSLDESVAKALLILSPPGLGKSRLRHEFLRRLANQKQDVLPLLGRGEPMSAGSSGGLLRQALRRLCGLQPGDELAVQQAKLRDRISRHLMPGDQSTLAFIGELCEVVCEDTASARAKLHAARQDPRIMRDRLSQAVVTFLRAECAAQPVLLVLEDVHWGDALTMHLLREALRRLHDQPFMALLLGRPEVLTMFPELAAPRIQAFQLRGLSKRACEQLIRHVLIEPPAGQALARMVDLAAGNPLFLEEMIRAGARGDSGTPPATILAMLQVRIGRLAPFTRRTLCAGSVFGSHFRPAAVLALIGAEHRRRLEEALARLRQEEIVELSRDDGQGQEPEYYFRHALVREAAYGLLTPDDQQLAHHLAAVQLEAGGSADPWVLAEHFQRGGQPEQALPYYLRAAEQSYNGSDLTEANRRVERGVACGASGELLGNLRALQCAAGTWAEQWQQAYSMGKEALTLLPSGSPWWCRAMGHLFIIAGNVNDAAYMGELIERFGAVSHTPDAAEPYAIAGAMLVVMFAALGERALAHRFLKRIEQAVKTLDGRALIGRGHVHHARAALHRFLEADPWQAMQLASQAMAEFSEAGDQRDSAIAQLTLGLSQAALGEVLAGEQSIRSSLALAQALGVDFIVWMNKFYLMPILASRIEDLSQEQHDELLGWIRDSIEHDTRPLNVGTARGALATIRLAQGRLAEAEQEAVHALEVLMPMRSFRIPVFTTLIHSLLQQSRAAAASAAAAEAVACLESMGGSAGYAEVALRLAIAQAHKARGDRDAARHELQEAQRQIRLRAERIPDALARERYLTAPPENKLIAALAREWESTDRR